MKRYEIAQLVVGLKADLTDYKMSLNEGLRDIKVIASEVGTLSDKFAKIGRGLGIVSGSITALGITTTKIFADLEQSIVNTASVTGDTIAGVDELEKHARSMGKSTVFTASQTGEAMYFLASAGYKTQDIFNSLNFILQLAAATNYDLAETTASVVSTLKAYNYTTDDAGRITNTFAAAISKSQATMLRLQESLKYIAPIASTLNLSIEQTTAALSLLYDSKLEASMAGTQLRMSLTRLLKPTNAAFNAMRQLGVEYKDINPAIHDLVEIIRALEDANAGAATKAKYMSEIFGTRAANAMNILVQNGSDALEFMEQSITGTSKAALMQQRQISSLRGIWRLLTSSLQEASIVMGKVLAPLSRTLMDSVRQLALTFSNLSETLQSIIVISGGVAAGLTGLLSIGLILTSFLPKLINLFALLRLAIIYLGSPISIAIGLVTALGASIVYLLSKKEREKRMMKDIQLEYTNYLNQKEDELRKTKHLVDVIHKLQNTLKTNETKYQHLQTAIKDLNDLHPDLINNEETLTSQMNKLAVVSHDASIKLQEIVKAKKRIKQYNLAQDIADLNKEISNLKDSLEIDWKDFMKEGVFREFINPSLDGWNKSKNVMLNDIEKIDSSMVNVINLFERTGPIINKTNPMYLQIHKNLLEIARTEQGRLQLMQLQDGLIIAASNNRMKGLEDVASVEHTISLIVGNIISKYSKIEKKMIKLKQLTNERKKDEKETIGVDTNYTTSQIEVEKKKEQLIYEITMAGIADRIELRKRELDFWKKQKLQELQYSQLTDKKYLDLVQQAYLIKKAENEFKNSQDIAAFNKAIVMKNTNDILAIKLANLKQEKQQALQQAMQIGQSTNEVNKQYAIALAKIQKEIALESSKAIQDLNFKTTESKIDAMLDSVDKERQIEDLNYKKKLIALEDNKRKAFIKVEQGLIDEQTVIDSFKEQFKNAEIEYNNSIDIIQRNAYSRRKKYLDEYNREKLQLLINDPSSSITDRELANEDLLYYNKTVALEKWLEKKNQLIEIGEANEIEISDRFTAMSDQLYAQYLAKKEAIRLQVDMKEWEDKLSAIDKDSELYDTMIENYIIFLTRKKGLLAADLDSYKNVFNKIKSLYKDLNDNMRDKSKDTQKMIGSGFEQLGIAIGKTGQGALYAYKDALKSMVKATADWLIGKIYMQLAESWKSPWETVGWLIALGGVRAAEHAAYGRIDSAAVGAEVKRSGVATVHEGETIIPSTIMNNYKLQPADLQRSTWDDYKNVLDNNKGSNININANFSFNADGAIISPAGIEQQDEFYEKVILPAEIRFKELLESTIHDNFN